MNWGNKLVVVFIAFAGLMFFLVYNAMNTRYELVSTTYYQDELRYQDKIEGKLNASTISEIEIDTDDDHLILQLPPNFISQSVKGDIWLYCKTDAQKDLRLTLAANEQGQHLIPKKQLKANKYLLKLSWETIDKKYYTEKDIELNIQ